MGLCYHKVRDYTKAISCFAKAYYNGMKDSPELLDAWGDAYRAQENYKDAGKKYRECFHLNPTIESCEKAVTCFIAAKIWVSSKEILDEGLKKFPKSTKLRRLLDSIAR